MTDYTSNPFFASPYIAQAGNNLIKAFNDDGHIALNKAHAGYYNAERDKVAGETAGRQTLAQIIAGQDFSGPIPTSVWSELGANAVRSGQNPEQLAQNVRFMRSNSGASDSDIVRAVVGASPNGIGVDQGVSLGDRNAISQRKEDAAFGRTKYSADSSAGAHIQGIRISNQFQEDHPTSDRVKGKYLQDNPDQVPASVFAPHNTPAGGQAAYAPGDPRATATPVPGPSMAEHFVQSENPEKPGTNTYQPVAANLPGKAIVEKPPHIINEKAVGQIEMDALNGVGLWDAGNNKPISQFSTPENTKKMQDGRIAAADVLQKTGNAGLAQKAYVDAIGIPAGSKVDGPGAIARMFGAGSVKVTPPEAPAGTTQAAPTISSNFAPPDAAAAPASGPAAAALDEARAAIAKGAPLAAVIQRLKQNGIDPSALNAPQNANDGAR